MHARIKPSHSTIHKLTTEFPTVLRHEYIGDQLHVVIEAFGVQYSIISNDEHEYTIYRCRLSGGDAQLIGTGKTASDINVARRMINYHR